MNARGGRVALTFDDLPVHSVSRRDRAFRDDVTRGLLAALDTRRVRATGFVNEGQMWRDGPLDHAEVALLDRWLAAGHELGNHTFSHADLHAVSVEEFERDIVRGEPVLRERMAAHGRRLLWFRHPYLHTGRDLAIRDAVTERIAARGCRVAPVTVYVADYLFAAAWDWAAWRGRAARMTAIERAFPPYVERVIEASVTAARALFGRDIPHVLLLHANALNARALGGVLDRMSAGGWTFVTLDEALADAAYAAEDRYTGPGGPTWLERWADARGAAALLPVEPRVPWGVRWGARTPFEVLARRQAVLWRESLYRRFKRPGVERFRRGR